MAVSGLLCLVICSVFTWSRGALFDDSMIYSRYVRNALHGHGFVFNPGERVNAMTSPLYSYVILALSFIFRNVLVVQRVFHAVALAAACCLAGVLVGRRASFPVAIWVPPLMASVYYFYTFVGLETPLFLALILLVLLLYDLNRPAWMGFVSALLILTRGEAVFLVAGLIALHFIQGRKRPPLWILLPPAAVFFLHYAYNYWFYGEFVPSTLTAKVAQFHTGIYGAMLFFRSLANVFTAVMGGQVVLMTMVLVLAGLGMLAYCGDGLVNLLVVFVLVLTGFYLAVQIMGYHWYFAPHFLALYVLVSLGLTVPEKLFRRFRRAGRAGVYLASGLALLVIVQQALVTFQSQVSDVKRSTLYTAAGQWIQQNTPEDASLACTEIGFLGYYSERRIIDLLGLVTPDINRDVSRGQEDSWIDTYKPDYVLIHRRASPAERPILSRVRAGQYSDVPGFAVPELRLLVRRGGSGKSGPNQR